MDAQKIYKEAFERKFSDKSEHNNSHDSAGFIKSVAKALEMTLPDTDTEGLVVYMEKNWLTHDDKFAAFKAAGNGEFVIVAALPGDMPNGVGHMAIMLAEKDRQNHHYLFGGSSNNLMRSKGENTLEYVFPKKMQHLLRFYSPKKTISENTHWQ